MAWLYGVANDHPLWFYVEDAIVSISRTLAKRHVAHGRSSPQRVAERLGNRDRKEKVAA